MRRSLLLSVLGFFALVMATTARADAPTITESTVTSPLTVLNTSATRQCGFTILSGGTISTRTLTFVDRDGAVTRETSHSTIDSVLVKESTGETLSVSAHWTQTHDFVAGTITISGLRLSVHAPGQAPGSVAVGRHVSGEQGPADTLFQTPGFSFPLLKPEICAMFSA